MRCAEARERLAAYADGAMPVREVMELLDHTAECAECRTRIEEMVIRRSRIAEALRSPVESPDIADSVMARLPGDRGAVVRWVWASMLVACAVVVLVLCLMHGPRREPYTARNTEVARPEPQQSLQQMAAPKEQAVVARKSDGEKPVPQMDERRSVVKRIHRAPGRNTAAPDKPEVPEQSEHAQSVVEEPIEQVVQPTEGVTSYQAYGQTVYVLPPNEDSESIERPSLRVVRHQGPLVKPIEPQGG